MQSFWVVGQRVYTLYGEGAQIEVHPSMYTLKDGKIELHEPKPKAVLVNEKTRLDLQTHTEN